MRFDEGTLKDILYAFGRKKEYFSKDGRRIRKFLNFSLNLGSCLLILNLEFLLVK